VATTGWALEPVWQGWTVLALLSVWKGRLQADLAREFCADVWVQACVLQE